MTNTELGSILESHKKWLANKEGGCRADLHGVDLSGFDFGGANLRKADLHGANLRMADLSRVDLTDADLSEADMCRSDLRGAWLRRSNLSGAQLRLALLIGADLRDANLCKADLCMADLTRADLRGVALNGAWMHESLLNATDLSRVDLSEVIKLPYIPMACPETGSFIGWKSARHYIVKLQIPEDALRSSFAGRKCRCNKALVLAIENMDGHPSDLKSVCSDFDESFVYTVGEVVESDFCMDRFVECAAGIHFFINRQEAVQYDI